MLISQKNNIYIKLKKNIINIIRLYQRYISPLKGTKCPFFPSCSEYGIKSIEKYGVIKGSLLGAFRIIRCNPFSKGGVDPVPEIGENYHRLIGI